MTLGLHYLYITLYLGFPPTIRIHSQGLCLIHLHIFPELTPCLIHS